MTCVNVVYFFFLSDFVYHRFLHSFPTRRSSDLLGDLAHSYVGSAMADVLDLVAILSALGDRKSTRLNSSHPSISYAVFCLKKKNKRAPTTTEALTNAQGYYLYRSSAA